MNKDQFKIKLSQWLDNIPKDTHEEYLTKLGKYKELIDKTPNKFLKFHLDNAIKEQQYELAQYIQETALKRNYEL